MIFSTTNRELAVRSPQFPGHSGCRMRNGRKVGSSLTAGNFLLAPGEDVRLHIDQMHPLTLSIRRPHLLRLWLLTIRDLPIGARPERVRADDRKDRVLLCL